MTHKTFFSNRDAAFLKKIVEEAGALGLRFQRKGFSQSRKADSSIVTTADLAVQDMLLRKIGSRFKDVSFIHEEGFDAKSTPPLEGITVIIDPIDGTAVFSIGLPCWCVSVGIFADGRPELGLVYSPGCRMFFYGDGQSALCNNKLLQRPSPPIVPEAETNIFLGAETIRKYELAAPGKIRNLGSAALHACMVAAGSFTRTLAFLGEGMLWDWAGAIPILEGAGCTLTYISGRPPDIKEIAANGCRLPEAAAACSNPKLLPHMLFNLKGKQAE